MRVPLRWALVLLAFAVLAALAQWQFMQLEFLGLDTWPMIAAARIDSFADFLGTFREELMDGYYTDGHFYRPVTNLAFALDEALHGLAPRGWHLTDTALLALNGTLLFHLVRRLFGARALLAAWAAGILFVLHPVQIEIFPVPARRADTLCLAFLLATWLALPRPGAARGERQGRALLAGLLALGAIGSKETGGIALPLAFAWQLLAYRGAPLGARFRSTLLDCAPALAGVLLFLGARTAVLDGIGGHHETAASMITEQGLLAFVEGYLARVAYPQPFFGASLDAARAVVWSAILGLALAAFALGRRNVAPDHDDGPRPSAFLVVWTLALFAISSLAGRIHDWYAMLFVAPYAVLFGVVLQGALRGLRGGPRVLASVALALTLGLATSHVLYSPLVRRYPMWQRASELSRDFLAQYTQTLSRTAPGERVVFERFVPYLPPHPDGSGVRSAFLLGEYSVQAYSDLVLPGYPVHVDFYTGGPLPPTPGNDVVHAVLFPGVMRSQ